MSQNAYLVLMLLGLHLAGCGSYIHVQDAHPVSHIQPSQVLKLDLYDDEDHPSSCRAVMISNISALSAAHCFPDFVLGGQVLVGNEAFKIKRIELHPRANLDGPMPHNDLAVVTFEQPLPLQSYPILVSRRIKAGDHVRMASADNSGVSGSWGGEMKVRDVGGEFIKVPYSGGSACHGDSGSGAFFDLSGRQLLVGIVSSGTKDNCGPGDESYFVNLQSQTMLDFIKKAVPATVFE